MCKRKIERIPPDQMGVLFGAMGYVLAFCVGVDLLLDHSAARRQGGSDDC